jgi:Amt family ammonium transporter
VKYWLNIDDALDIFAEHGVAGMAGLMANALFGADYIVGLDGVTTGAKNPTTGTFIGGWVIGNYRQFYIQLAYVLACTGYAFTVSAILAYGINLIPGLHLRASEEAELLGMDDDQLGEFAYDYVEVRRDYLAWTPAQEQPQEMELSIEKKDRYGIPGYSNMLDGVASEKNGEAQPPDTGHAHTGVGGDRHGIAAEKVHYELRHVPNC